MVSPGVAELFLELIQIGEAQLLGGDTALPSLSKSSIRIAFCSRRERVNLSSVFWESRLFLLAADRARLFVLALAIFCFAPSVHALRPSVAVQPLALSSATLTSPLETRAEFFAPLPVGRLSLADHSGHEIATGCSEFAYETSSGLRRWLNGDPLKEGGGINLYRFCGGDPVNRVDSWGLFDGIADPATLALLQDPEVLKGYTSGFKNFVSGAAESFVAGWKLSVNLDAALAGFVGFIGDAIANPVETAQSIGSNIKASWTDPENITKNLGGLAVDAITGGGPLKSVRKLKPAAKGGLFRGGNSLAARLGVDVKQAADGLIHPLGKNGKPQGLSLNLDPKDPFIQKYGGAFPVNSLPEGLQALQTGNPGHFVVAPTTPITFERYQQLLNQVQLGNFNVIE